MYYHCRPLKYVEYGKVLPPLVSEYDTWDANMYGWLGHHCGFYPQVWLSRSHSMITGYRNENIMKKRKCCSGKRSIVREHRDSVLFGFEIIQGFSISYMHWELLMNSLLNESNFEKQNKSIIKTMESIVSMYEEEIDEKPEGEVLDWLNSGCDLNRYLTDYVFKEKDQIVVPSLNLKSAKKIICKNEAQKKKLRKMGFIEDRILIKNLK